MVNLYNAEISAGSLLIPESRRIAELLLSQPGPQAWDDAIVRENLLQKSPATAKRQAKLIRNRLQTLDAHGLKLVVQSDAELCGQLLMAAALRHSQLMADFMRDVYATDLRHLERSLSHRQWDSFLTDCAHRDEAVNTWARSTRLKLFQVIVRILVETKFLDSTKHMNLTPPMLHPRLHTYLTQLGARDTLARMEFGQMIDRFDERLNQVLPRLLSPDVLDNRGAGGEIGFWIFDYPVEREMDMRKWLSGVIEPGIQRQRPDLKFTVIDLFQEVLAILQERNLLDKAYDMQTRKGDAALLASLRSVLKEDRLAARLAEKTDAANLDLLIVKGVGAVYPMLRTHTLLSALHPHMSHTPLLMLYPGVYDGLSLKLFNTLTDDNYYRAFRLVS